MTHLASLPPEGHPPMRIIGPPSATWDTARGNLVGAAALFHDHIAPAVWNAALDHGIDPVGAVAQAFKETGGGRFGGQVKPEFCNTAGIKNRHLGLYPGVDDGDRPLAHARFANWETGARAQAEHLRAYTGWPIPGPPVDPRYDLALKGPHNWVETWAGLGGKWAPAADYGTSIESIMRRLQGRA